MLERNNGDLIWGPGCAVLVGNPMDMSLWGGHAENYLLSGATLIERLDEMELEVHQRSACFLSADQELRTFVDPQALVLPSVNLIRIGTGLLLKTLWLCRIANDEEVAHIETIHSLDTLFKKARPILETMNAGDYLVDLKELVAILHEIAPSGNELEYPANRAMTDFTKPLQGKWVAEIMSVPHLNVSKIGRLAKSVVPLIHTATMVEERLANQREAENAS